MPDGSIILEIEARDNGLTKTLTQAQSAAIKTAASMQTLAQSVQQTTRSVSALAASFHTAGTSWGMSLTAGFRTGLTGVTGVSQSAVNSALIPWKSAGSAAFSLGYAVPSGAAQGMNAGNFLVSQAAAVCARSIQSAFSGGGWGNLGYQISGGIARGIASGSSLISVAARSAAQSALKTAKNSLGIRSPSRLFRDEVGKMIPAGMAEGILDGAGELGNAISDASRRLLSFSRQA